MDTIRSILEGLQVTGIGEDLTKRRQMWSELRRQLLRMRPRIMMPAKSWTVEEKQKLQELWENGKTIQDIARGRRANPWTAAERQKLQELWENGKTIQVVATGRQPLTAGRRAWAIDDLDMEQRITADARANFRAAKELTDLVMGISTEGFSEIRMPKAGEDFKQRILANMKAANDLLSLASIKQRLLANVRAADA